MSDSIPRGVSVICSNPPNLFVADSTSRIDLNPSRVLNPHVRYVIPLCEISCAIQVSALVPLLELLLVLKYQPTNSYMFGCILNEITPSSLFPLFITKSLFLFTETDHILLLLILASRYVF